MEGQNGLEAEYIVHRHLIGQMHVKRNGGCHSSDCMTVCLLVQSNYATNKIESVKMRKNNVPQIR